MNRARLVKIDVWINRRIRIILVGLILGVKTCEPHEWRKTINTKKTVRSQDNRAKENNTRKQRKSSQVFTPRMTLGSSQTVFSEKAAANKALVLFSYSYALSV